MGFSWGVASLPCFCGAVGSHGHDDHHKVHVSTWEYDRCSDKAPDYWTSGSCSGSEGSPINLCGAETHSSLTRFVTSNWNAQRNLEIFNNGHTVQVMSAKDDHDETRRIVSKAR